MTPATELVKMIEPPWPRSTIDGAAAFTVFHRPVRLMSMTSCHISSDSSRAGAKLAIPALAITMSMCPNWESPVSTAAWSDARSRTSACWATIRRSSDSTSFTVSSNIFPYLSLRD